jgi:predicted metalloprotease
MRLNPFNPGSINVRRGGGGSGFPGGGGGKLGCGSIVVVLIGALVFGIDPGQMLGTMEGAQQGTMEQTGAQNETAAQICDDNAYASESCNALGNLNETWQPLFNQAGIPFQQPTLVFYQGGTRSGCGAASSAMGPFYCPADQGIYIDTSFYDQMQRELGAGGDFARYYVIAHEYGHHVQTITGVADQIRSAQQQNPRQANQLQVLMELQADCYAGVWAGRNRNLIEPGDFEEGMTAASAIGDDTLARRSGQAVSPESFTHGTSEQRMEALRLGLESGDEGQCDRIMQTG